jgi:hypothetical protein
LPPEQKSPASWPEIAAEADPSVIAAELQRLPAERLLLAQGEYRVYCTSAREIPTALAEIGRLREIAFRGVGEGTGRTRDLDAFDERYLHLFLWQETTRQILGAYRLARVDEVRHSHGTGGLYTSTLFKFREPLFHLLGPTLELGRSFVRVEVQRSFVPMLMLWKGIGALVARDPRYVTLIGPASISNDFSALSKRVMVEYLRRQHFDPLLSQFVTARQPFPRGGLERHVSAEVASLGHIDALSSLVEDLEADGKAVPVLLRQYLRLNGKILAFNIDPAFNDAIDCLLLVDLRQSDPGALARFLPARVRVDREASFRSIFGRSQGRSSESTRR